MLTFKLTANNCNPAILTDYVLVANAMLAAVSRCDFHLIGTTYMANTLCGVFYVNAERTGYMQFTIEERSITATFTADDRETGKTMLAALVEQLGITDAPTVQMLD